MSENRDVAQPGRAPALGAGGQGTEAPHPDHSCLVAQYGVTVWMPKQAMDSKRNLVYSQWSLLAIEPQASNVFPGCILVIVRVAKYRAFLYKTASQTLRPVTLGPECHLRCP